MAEAASPGATHGSADTLRRVKEVEGDFDQRLARIRSEGEASVAKARADADGAVQAARAEADARREAALALAREAAVRDAEALRAHARLEAAMIDQTSSLLASVPTERLVEVVLRGLTDTSDG